MESTKEDFMTDVFVADRSVQIAKLKTDLQVATSNAELTGVPLHAVICELLEIALHWREVAADRGNSLAELAALGDDA